LVGRDQETADRLGVLRPCAPQSDATPHPQLRSVKDASAKSFAA
jgi:hypothetical protein